METAQNSLSVQLRSVAKAFGGSGSIGAIICACLPTESPYKQAVLLSMPVLASFSALAWLIILMYLIPFLSMRHAEAITKCNRRLVAMAQAQLEELLMDSTVNPAHAEQVRKEIAKAQLALVARITKEIARIDASM